MEETARLPQAIYAKEEDQKWWRCEENKTLEIWGADVFPSVWLNYTRVKYNFKIYVGWIRMSLENTLLPNILIHCLLALLAVRGRTV